MVFRIFANCARTFERRSFDGGHCRRGALLEYFSYVFIIRNINRMRSILLTILRAFGNTIFRRYQNIYQWNGSYS